MFYEELYRQRQKYWARERERKKKIKAAHACWWLEGVELERIINSGKEHCSFMLLNLPERAFASCLRELCEIALKAQDFTEGS